MRDNIEASYRTMAEKAYAKWERTDDENRTHIVSIAASVMMTRDKILIGGGFVQAVIADKLGKSIQMADSVCKRNLDFFVYCRDYVFDITDEF